MGPEHSIRSGLIHSFALGGRTSRREFWWFALFLSVSFGMLIVPVTLADIGLTEGGSRVSGNYHPLIWAVILVFAIPFRSAGARRSNDMGWHGVLIFLPALLVIVSYLGGRAISGSASSSNYNGFASWPFSIAMICAFLISTGAVLAALTMPTRPLSNPMRSPDD